MQEAQKMQFLSLGWEDPLSRKWQPTPVFLPGDSHGQRSLVGYSPWGHKELDMPEVTEHACMHAYNTCMDLCVVLCVCASVCADLCVILCVCVCVWIYVWSCVCVPVCADLCVVLCMCVCV